MDLLDQVSPLWQINLINKNEHGFKTGEKTEGIWIWGKPIVIDDETRLLILDCQGINNNNNKDDINNINQKLFILSILLSTNLIYVTKGEITNEMISEFLSFTDLSERINIEDVNNNTKVNDIFKKIYYY